MIKIKYLILVLFFFSFSLSADNLQENQKDKLIEFDTVIEKLREKISNSNDSLWENYDNLKSKQQGLSEIISNHRNYIMKEKLLIDSLYRMKNKQNLELRKKIKNIERLNSNLSNNIEFIKSQMQSLEDSLLILSKEFDDKLNSRFYETKDNISNIKMNIDKRTSYIIIGSIILLGIIISILLILKTILRKKIEGLDKKIVKTRNKMEEETVELDSKLVEILKKQMQLTEQKPKAKDEEIDHSVFIKVANEIQRMRRRIKHMPEDTKGIGALKNALRRLEEELNDNDYELVDYTGKEFVDGMTVKARFIPSDKIETGKRIITKTIKPQVNYKGVLVQMSNIEITKGE